MGNSDKWRTRTTSFQVSVGKLGYESLRPEQETVVQEFFFPASRCLQYGKRRRGGRGPRNEATFDNRETKKGEFLLLCASPLISLKVDQKAKFVPRGMSAQFVDEAQCDPRAVESIHEGKAQSESFCQCALHRG